MMSATYGRRLNRNWADHFGSTYTAGNALSAPSIGFAIGGILVVGNRPAVPMGKQQHPFAVLRIVELIMF